MALQRPNKLLEQAKSILDDDPGLFNSEILGHAASNERNDVAEEAKDYPRERRPALGHKRAHFSLKPNKNHPTEILKPNLDIDNLKEPEEFFMAYERLENAKRAIQKQMGGALFEPNQHNTSTKARQRRLGLLGNNQRRSVRYKHRYSMETSDNNDNVPSSQETFESDSLGPFGENTDKTGAHLASLESELADSAAMEENKINDILDELLHRSCEDLDRDGAIPLLQESLQIRPIFLEKLTIPDLPDNRVTDLKSFGGNLSKPRSSLYNMANLLKEMSNTTPVKLRQDVGSPVQQLASPTPPKSPFAPLSTLQKRISQSKPSVDPFSSVNIDNLFTRHSSLIDMVNQELNVVNSGKSAPLFKDVVAVSKTSLVEDGVKKCNGSSGKFKEDNPGKTSNKMNALLTKDVIAVRNTSTVEETRNCASTSGKSKEDNARELGFDTNLGLNESHVDMDVDIGGSGMGDRVLVDTVSRPNFEANGPCQFKDKAENMQEAVASVPADDPDLNLVNPLDQSSPARSQANAMDECNRTSDDDAEQCLQVQEKIKASNVSVNEQRKDKLHSRREHKDKGLSRSQSLAAAGMSWKSGVRRSTRIKTRPLEYWKGERLLYGRVHKSLATVIGVKYMSPGSADGKPTMKVKSYVADKYKDLLELASQY